MENHFLMTNDLLWDYADGLLSNQEKLQVDAYLKQHPEWKTHLDMVLAEKQELASLPLETPASGFSDRVMAAWAAERVKSTADARGDDWIIRIIAVVFGLFILMPVVLMVVAAVQLSPEEAPTFELPQVSLPTVPVDTWLSNTVLQYGLLLVFVAVGLRFLDKILRHRLAAKSLA